MKRIFKSLIIGFIVFIENFLFGQVLQWDIPTNERIEIVRTATVKQSVNNTLLKNFTERNIINLSCYKKETDGSLVKGTFTVYQKEEGLEIFKKIDEFTTDFKILTNGKFIVDKKYLMPNVRNIPMFPLNKINKGETWKGEGEILFINFPQPFSVSFPVTYTLSDIKTINNSEIAVIQYSYTINKIFKEWNLTGMPAKITGNNIGIILWDIQNKKPYQMHDTYNVNFLFAESLHKTFSANLEMNIATQFTIYQKLNDEEKKKAIKDIENALSKTDGIEVADDSQGIAIRLGEILFDFDSYRLKPQSQKNLEIIAQIIKEKYADREIIVEGHTDNIGSAEYNQKLSENRAHSVAKFLLHKGISDKLSYRGYGMHRPLFDNSTEEGRSKNRRVDIIIKTK